MLWGKLKQAGFTIIEVTVAMSLVTALGMMVMQMVQWQTKSAKSISIVMDRNQLTDQVRSLVSNSESCPKVFGSVQGLAYPPTTNPKDAISIARLYASNGTARFLEPTMTPVPNSSYWIEKIELAPAITGGGPPPLPYTYDTGSPRGSRTQYRKVLEITMWKTPPIATGGNVQVSPDGPHNVGGDSLRTISVPIVMQVDKITNKITGCSTDGGTPNDQAACENQPGHAWVAGPDEYFCATIVCKANEFPVGATARGDVKCCALGTHPAGVADGSPVCCATGRIMKSDGTCSTSVDAVCPPGESAKSSSSDGSANCCRMSTSQNRCSPNAKECKISNFCGNGYHIEDPWGGCMHGDKMNWLRIANNYTELQAECSDAGVYMGANCCHFQAAPFLSVITAPCNDPHEKRDSMGVCTFDPNSCLPSNNEYASVGAGRCLTKKGCFDNSLALSGNTCEECVAPDTFQPFGTQPYTVGRCRPH